MKLSDFSREARIVDLERKELREKLLKEATYTLDFANNTYEVYEGPVNSLTQKPFNDILTFTRGSAATARNAIGGITDVLTDEQRLVGNREGLLIEEQRTNLLLWSEDFTKAAWGISTAAIVPSSVSAPDGSGAFFKIIPQNGATFQLLQQPLGIAENTAVTVSCFFKPAEWDSLRIGIRAQDGSVPSAVFNATTKTMNVGNTVSAGFVELGNGEYYVWAACESGAGPIVPAARYYPINNGSTGTAGDGTSGIYIWGAQLEARSQPSSYIKTEASQVTRAEETVSLTDFANWYGSEGTFHCKVKDVANVVGLFEVNGTPLLENVSGSGTLTITYDRNNNQKLYVDGELVYTLSSYHGIDLVDIMDAKLADGGVATCQLVTYMPRQLSAYEIGVIGGNL